MITYPYRTLLADPAGAPGMLRRLPAIVVALCLMPVMTGLGAAAGDNRAETGVLDAQLANDTLAVRISRDGLAGVVDYLEARTGPGAGGGQPDGRLLARPRREKIRTAWRAFLDYMALLDAIQLRYADVSNYPAKARDTVFNISYAAFLAKYRYALDFIAVAEQVPDADILLNDPVPELGMPSRRYARLKFHYLNVLLGVDFARLEALHALRGADEEFVLAAAMQSDAKRIWSAGKWEGPAATVRNGADIFSDTLFRMYFPVQKNVSQWMGDVKVLRTGETLISQAQIARLARLLQPGDILLQRREWYLSNIGLPGFWSHAALYVGTPEERRAYFDDGDVHAWLRQAGMENGDFESWLEERYPDAHRASRQPDQGHPPRVIEAISEGVVFTTLEHSADADSLVVLRPRLPKSARARAVERAFRYSGRPYDFNFDFRTDEALVCTELIYKAYEPGRTGEGLQLPLTDVLGRPVTPANDIARQFDETYGSDSQQFDFVLFLDGQEHKGIAQGADIAAFRESWRRPKWHVVRQVLEEQK